MKPGALIRITAPRQMGKTSLMVRILRHAKQQGCLTVALSFQVADTVVFNNLNNFLRWFCASVGRRLQLPNRLNEQWDEMLGSKGNCTAYFETYLLTEISQPLALGLDEVDIVFNNPEIASDFFGLLRAWHEQARFNPIWQKLRLVVAHSKEAYLPLDINQSPFNVGLPIELPVFKQTQVQTLVERYGLGWTVQQISQLIQLTGGHPYLVRVALQEIATGNITLEQLITNASTEPSIFSDHLDRYLHHVLESPDLTEALAKIFESNQGVRIPSSQAFKLNSMGLIKIQGRGYEPACDLYRHYFRDRLPSST